MVIKASRKPPDPNAPDGRPMCYSCMRPRSHCVCGLIQPFTAHCNILILQHPHERRKYYSTAKLVLQAIRNSRLMRGIEFNPLEIDKIIVPDHTYLLFPNDDAVDCETISLDEKDTVIVVDGTWSEAGKIVRRNPFLSGLPTLTFTQALRSRYRIRKQPKENYLSTIECIGHLLKINAHGINAEQYDRLFDGFDKMIEQQLNHHPQGREFF